MADVEQAVIEIRGVIRDLITVEEWVQQIGGSPEWNPTKTITCDELLDLFRYVGRIRATANDALDVLTLPARDSDPFMSDEEADRRARAGATDSDTCVPTEILEDAAEWRRDRGHD